MSDVSDEFSYVDDDKGKIIVTLDRQRAGQGPYMLYAVAGFLNPQTGRPEIAVISNYDDFSIGGSDPFPMSALCAEHVAAVMVAMASNFKLSLEQLVDDVSNYAMKTKMTDVEPPEQE